MRRPDRRGRLDVRILSIGAKGVVRRAGPGRDGHEEVSVQTSCGKRSDTLSEFRYGEKVMLIDGKQRRYLITLTEGAEFHSHAGYVAHSEIVGLPEGKRVESTRGARYIALRPTLEDFVIEMPRGAQVIYPKDLAPICMLADIAPGIRVFESGVGSGALSMTMLRWGAEIVGYELREDFAQRARANVSSFLGAAALDRYHVEVRDAYEGIDEALYGTIDRVVLDLPEPWHMVAHAEKALRTGGILVAYTPSITQAAETRHRMANPRWAGTRTLEVLHRGWYIEGNAVRPDHRMVAHTGFLTTGRLLGE
ncbi:MAG: putative tRNA ((1)-)-methyltransferase [Actinomycetota bacterium]|jgi:tRNA (adenine57-N1/adenine58-N1)-methyltransferase